MLVDEDADSEKVELRVGHLAEVSLLKVAFRLDLFDHHHSEIQVRSILSKFYII